MKAVSDTVDIHWFIRIMHALGFIHVRISGAGEPTHSEAEEQELTEMWRSLGTKDVHFQSLFTAIAALLNIQLPEMLGSVEERLDNQAPVSLIHFDQHGHAYFRTYEDIAKYHRQFRLLA